MYMNEYICIFSVDKRENLFCIDSSHLNKDFFFKKEKKS